MLDGSHRSSLSQPAAGRRCAASAIHEEAMMKKTVGMKLRILLAGCAIEVEQGQTMFVMDDSRGVRRQHFQQAGLRARVVAVR